MVQPVMRDLRVEDPQQSGPKERVSSKNPHSSAFGIFLILQAAEGEPNCKPVK